MKYWEATLATLAALSASIARAEDFKTINGKEYKNVTVSRVEADGIVLRTKTGISKVYFAELPKDVQERFHDASGRAVTHSTDQDAASTQAVSATPITVSSDTLLPRGDSSPGPTKWTYSERQDEMGRGTMKLAQVASSNTIQFGFPYQGETHAILQLRRSPKLEYGQDVMLWVERGQFVSSHTKPLDNTTGLLFIDPVDAESLRSELSKAKKLKIEADFYQEGPRVFEFDVRGLTW